MPPLTLDGTTGVSAVQAGAVESGDLPAGSLIQVKHVVTKTSVDVSSGGVIVDLGLSIDITPVSQNSKFLLFCKIQARMGVNSPSGYGLVWFRNSNEVRTPNDYFEVWSSADMYSCAHFQYFDAPQTVSTITYEAKPETYNSNNVEFSQGGNFDHNLTVMEIAG